MSLDPAISGPEFGYSLPDPQLESEYAQMVADAARALTVVADQPGSCGDEETCMVCGDKPREILPVPCASGCCDLALCIPCAATAGYEIA